MPPTHIERPVFWIVGGPNGSGKSTALQDETIEAFGRSFWVINPDLLARHIRENENLLLDAANLQAVQRIEAWLETSIRAYQTVGVETVLSTDKYRRLVVEAKERRYEIGLIYVILDSADRSVQRVKIRAQTGGHDVPEDKIRARYDRSLAQLPWFLNRADRAVILDNSTASPMLICEKKADRFDVGPTALPQIVDAVRRAQEDDRLTPLRA